MYVYVRPFLFFPFSFPINRIAGTTYRTREEVGGVRTARDPIDYVKKILVGKCFVGVVCLYSCCVVAVVFDSTCVYLRDANNVVFIYQFCYIV